jgi:hypothetical protein
MSAVTSTQAAKSVGYHCRSRIAGRTRDLLDVALLVNRLAAFISAQINS